MSDELMFPSVPEAKPEDPEDVSWALSTAEAMWARGDHLEGIKWVRRAAEAASEAENDGRALELAKAAADLAGLLSRRVSRASIDIEEVVPMSEPEPPPVPKAPPMVPLVAPKPAPAPAAPVASPSPIANAPKPTAGMTKQTSTPSRPPAPLPSRTSQPPPGKQTKPLGTNTGRPPSMRPGAPTTATATTTATFTSTAKGPDSKRDGKKARRSRENLEAEARAGLQMAQATIETAKHPAVDERTAERVLPAGADTAETAIAPVPLMPERKPSSSRPKRPGGDDPTTISHVNDVQLVKRSTDEWDADMTQNLTGDDFPLFPGDPDDGERMTAVGLPPPDFKSTLESFPRPAKAEGARRPSSGGTNPPATVAAILNNAPPLGVPAAPGAFPHAAPARPASIEPHDPKITTTQAVRVVVWRDANGVHVAPAGTVVSAITVDAVLVALEPNADLTAWLTQRGR